LKSKVRKGGIPRLARNDVENILIPLSPLSRQQEIVSTLDTMSSLIDKLKEEIELRKKQYEYYREALLSF
jgi:type I restriction enzyme S subunit